MQSTVANRTTEKTNLASWFLDNRGLLGLLLLLIAFPFLLSLVEGQSFGDVLANESGNDVTMSRCNTMPPRDLHHPGS